MPEKSEPALTIPIIDIAPYLAGELGALETIASQSRQVSETVGFLTIINHGLLADLIEATPAGAAPRPRDETAPKSPITGTLKHRAALTKLAFAVLLLCLASLPAQAEKVVRAVLNTELAVLDPIATTINATRVFAYLVFDQLVAIDSKGKYHPQMLESWRISDDKLTYTFILRDGLLWSDGTPVTATDCVASMKRWGKRDGFAKSLMAMTKTCASPATRPLSSN
jgi:hypothetical protein